MRRMGSEWGWVQRDGCFLVCISTSFTYNQGYSYSHPETASSCIPSPDLNKTSHFNRDSNLISISDQKLKQTTKNAKCFSLL